MLFDDPNKNGKLLQVEDLDTSLSLPCNTRECGYDLGETGFRLGVKKCNAKAYLRKESHTFQPLGLENRHDRFDDFVMVIA